MPQVELAIGDALDVLVLRNLLPLSADDEELLRQFADAHRVQLFLQPSGPDSAYAVSSRGQRRLLYYTLPDFDLNIRFSPTDFTQVNHDDQPRAGAARAYAAAPQPGERIADLFCGHRQFLAGDRAARCRRRRHRRQRRAAQRAHGERSGSTAWPMLRSSWQTDLFKIDTRRWPDWRFDRMLIDPPRDGAIELVKALGADAPRAHRLRILQSGDAGARCRRCWCIPRIPAARGRRGQHVSAYFARRIDRGV